MMIGIWRALPPKAERRSEGWSRGRGGCLWALLLLLLLALPETASSQGLPGSWQVRFDDDGVSIVVTPAVDLRDARVQVTGRGVPSPRHEEARAQWPAGEAWTVRAPLPPREAVVEFRIEATAGESRVRMLESMTVPGTSRPALDVDTRHWDPARPRLVVRHHPGFEAYSIRVIGEDGEEHHEARVEPTGDVVEIAWDPTPVPPLLLEVRGWTPSGGWVEERLVPWSFRVQVENVLFPTGSTSIPEDEAHKLQAGRNHIVEVVGRVGAWVDVQLYIAGYTDTVGDAASNQRLSEARALALARWMRAHGVEVPIFYQGFGEEGLAVPTGDQVEEERNRRAVFMLGDRPPEGRDFPRSRWQGLR